MNERIRTMTDAYNVIYRSPGRSDRSAMPLGNGRLGVSAWVEEDGDLQFYIGHTDAQSELDRNLKLGKVLVSLDPNPFVRGAEFTQELVLREGCVRITARHDGNTVRALVLVDAETDAILVRIDSERPIRASARLHCWRTGAKSPWGIPDLESGAGGSIHETSDVVRNHGKGILFHHRNGRTCVKSTAILEALGEETGLLVDTLENRTFGGYLALADGIAEGEGPVLSAGAKTHHEIRCTALCEQTPDAEDWSARVVARHAALPSFEIVAERTAAHWERYFEQSHLFVEGDAPVVAPVPEDIAAVSCEPDDVDAPPSKVTQGYLLTKTMHACSSGGKVPMPFNGAIFHLMPGLDRHLAFEGYCATFAAPPAGPPGLEINPDEKGWESCINLWQNVRLPYAAMLARGEFESVRRLFGYYRNFWEINRARARIYYGAEGQFNTEMTNSFGLQPVSVYGADRTGLPDGYAVNRWGGAVDISPGLELCSMMLDYHEYTQDEAFLQEEALPYAADLLRFIETRFRERVGGRIRLTKLQCVETYFDTTDPITVVAGMHAVIGRILTLPPGIVANRDYFEGIRAILPELPLEKDDEGRVVLAPAREYERKRMNVETPELYPVYPYRLFARTKGDRRLIHDTYRNSLRVSGCFQPHRFEYAPGHPCYAGWQYVGMVAAMLGLTSEAEEILVNNAALKNPGNRFPAMWGPVYDAVPDGDHGANLTNTLQLMALQSEGDAIHLLPAWPKHWDVDFKLHAAKRTTVECEFRKGRIVRLEVTPPERRKDVVCWIDGGGNP